MNAGFAVLRVFLHYWGRHRLQALLGLAGIAAGVAVFTSIRIANTSAQQSFADGMEVISGRATHRIFSPGGGAVPDELYARVRAAPAVTAATPFMEGRLLVNPSADGPQRAITVYGIDPLSGQEFQAFRVAEADAGAGSGTLERFLAVPGAVALSRPLAERLGAPPGTTLPVRAANRRLELVVTARYDAAAGSGERLRNVAVADIATFQETFGRLGELDAIDLQVVPGREAAVEALLPPGVALEPAGRRSERVARMAEAFRLNLEALGLFALLVAVFLIFNAATFSVVQRSEAIAFLRCIGASRGTVFAALMAENVALGAAGGLLGVWLGGQLASLMVRFTGATLYEVILETEVVPIPLAHGWELWGVGILLGAGVAGGGVLAPALEGARISPMAAVRTARGDRAPAIGYLLLAGGGLALLAGAAALSLPHWDSAAAGLGAATAVALAGALLCPLALVGIGRVATPGLALLAGPVGRLAGRSIGRSLGRSGVAAAALMVALALALAIQVTVQSFRTTFQVWMEQAIRADIYLESYAADGGGHIPAGFAARLSGRPWVRDLAELRSRRLVLENREVRLLAIDGGRFARNSRVIPESQRGRVVAALRDGAVIVSETLAYPLGLGEGDMLTLPTETGPRRYPVAFVMRNFTLPSGVVYLQQETYAAAYGREPATTLGIWLADGHSPEEAVRAIAAMPEAAVLDIKSNAAVRKEALRVFDRTFAIADLMGGLAAVIAFLAVFSALTALLEERIRTVGYLRAIGVSRRVLAVSMALEACLLAVTAALVSWGAGLVMSAILVFVVNRQAFGWTLLFRPETGSYLPLAALAVAAALLGSLYPIVRATRLSVTATIREE